MTKLKRQYQTHQQQQQQQKHQQPQQLSTFECPKVWHKHTGIESQTAAAKLSSPMGNPLMAPLACCGDPLRFGYTRMRPLCRHHCVLCESEAKLSAAQRPALGASLKAEIRLLFLLLALPVVLVLLRLAASNTSSLLRNFASWASARFLRRWSGSWLGQTQINQLSSNHNLHHQPNPPTYNHHCLRNIRARTTR